MGTSEGVTPKTEREGGSWKQEARSRKRISGANDSAGRALHNEPSRTISAGAQNAEAGLGGQSAKLGERAILSADQDQHQDIRRRRTVVRSHAAQNHHAP